MLRKLLWDPIRIPKFEPDPPCFVRREVDYPARRHLAVFVHLKVGIPSLQWQTPDGRLAEKVKTRQSETQKHLALSLERKAIKLLKETSSRRSLGWPAPQNSCRWDPFAFSES
jgi:hypothetical protein